MKKQQSLGFQALNQARTASHALGFITGFMGLVGQAGWGEATHPYGQLFSIVRKAMREMATIQAASVLDKQKNSTGMVQLIAKVQAEQPELRAFCNDLKKRLDAHEATFKKAVFVRSNIVAHRSKVLTYKEVHDKAALDSAELAKAIAAWFEVAQELAIKLRGKGFWITYELEIESARLIKDLSEKNA